MRSAIYGAGSLGTISGPISLRRALVNRNKAHVEALRTNGARVTGTVEFTQKVNAISPDEMVCAFDSSTIELCLSLCPWATLHHGKGGFKMHTLMDLNSSLLLISNSIGQILFKRCDICDFYNKPAVSSDVPEGGSARQLTLW